jgi:hypothetical protein
MNAPLSLNYRIRLVEIGPDSSIESVQAPQDFIEDKVSAAAEGSFLLRVLDKDYELWCKREGSVGYYPIKSHAIPNGSYLRWSVDANEGLQNLIFTELLASLNLNIPISFSNKSPIIDSIKEKLRLFSFKMRKESVVQREGWTSFIYSGSNQCVFCFQTQYSEERLDLCFETGAKEGDCFVKLKSDEEIFLVVKNKETVVQTQIAYTVLPQENGVSWKIVGQEMEGLPFDEILELKGGKTAFDFIGLHSIKRPRVILIEND